MFDLSGLTEAQKEAVDHTDGPLLVVAGAGTGKTKVITSRIVRLLKDGISADRMLALTFTNKAAREMKHRVEHMVGLTPIWIHTFHGTCARFLRQEATHLGYGANWSIIDSTDKRQLLKRACRQLEIDRTQLSPAQADHHISRFKQDLCSPQQVRDAGDDEQTQRLATLYEHYLEQCQSLNVMDFDDLLVNTWHVLKHKVPIREHWQERCAYILVDEYQDTNALQYQIVKLLAGSHHNVCATGDPDQSIYSWRGADINNILNFKRDFPETKTIKLESNWRSTQTILKAASHVIQNNTQRIDRGLHTDNPVGDRIQLKICDDEEQEAETAIATIQQELDQGTPPTEIALLVRVNSQTRTLERHLLRREIPYTLVGGTPFYSRHEIKDLMSYLQVIANPKNSEAFRRAAMAPRRGIGEKSLAQFLEWSESQGLSVLDALNQSDQAPSLNTRAKKQFVGLRHLFSLMKESLNNQGVTAALEECLNTTDFDHHLQSLEGNPEDRQQNVQELLRAAAEHDQLHGAQALDAFLAEASLSTDLDRWDPAAPRVALMTLHSAKGLEFNAVIIVGLDEGLLPHQKASEEQGNIEEERRLFYVGLTRARHRVTLTRAKRRRFFGPFTWTQASPFLDELPNDVVERPASQEQALEIHDSAQDDFSAYFEDERYDDDQGQIQAGAVVQHPKFGRGQILSIGGFGQGRRARIRFAGGSKELLLAYAPLTLVD